MIILRLKKICKKETYIWLPLSYIEPICKSQTAFTPINANQTVDL
ncbi:hypothetical protein AM1_3261 [Acaryochloris marina MBIC11017]|uniref:Uncharacterized protein n=1 Tax=Acaryochloris marina (strain MBIC 11017) TaxID=329726 RepID=B0CFV3_ACAM1|nr:hypothetical protein AM1_3261 [Acaryochloris marina MBIC11017]